MTGTKLPDNLLPDLRVPADVLRTDLVERKLSGFQCAVVAVDAIAIDDGTFRGDGCIPRLWLKAYCAEEASGQE
jgi:hypothetical protein